MSDLMKVAQDLSEEVNKSCKKRNEELADSFHDTYIKYGDLTYFTRLIDLFNRIELLMNDNKKFIDNDELDNILIELSNMANLWLSSRYIK